MAWPWVKPASLVTRPVTLSPRFFLVSLSVGPVATTAPSTSHS